ncbi:MAG TPA: DUF2946 family protein [Gammaproteobacteria bacterium]|jgi:hypothetical protein|nr:DUF2946 family protein [Gammaproteobacteria bacterium]
MSRQSLTLLPRASLARRGLWSLVGLMLLAVQTGLPAHQDSHPLNQPDIACHYCMLAGHAPGMPTLSAPPPPSLACHEAPRLVAVSRIVRGFPRTRFSRGPPSRIDA